MIDKLKTFFAWFLVLIVYPCWIAFFLLCPFSHSKIKTFLKAYPWGTTDTNTVANQRELAWERSKDFSFLLEGMGDIPSAKRLLYDRPAIIMYRVAGDTAWFNANAIARPGKIDSMYAWISRNGYFIDSCYLHWDSTRVWASAFLEAWSSSNDANSNGIRDFNSYEGLVTRYGVNYIVKTGAGWTNNQYLGKGVYTLTGTLLDTVVGNSAESLWYNVADTTNILTNWSFETGDSNTTPSGWTNYASREKLWEVTWQHSCSLRSCAVIPDDSVDWLYLYQKVDTDSGIYYRLRFKAKSNNIYLRVVLRPGNSFDNAFWDWTMPTDSVDGNWHTFAYTILNTHIWNEDSTYVSFGQHVPHLGDTSFIDCIEFFPIKGMPPTWSSTGDFGENVIYRPFIIDSLGIANHTATAQTESLARCPFIVNEELANPNYSGYRYFQKWWSAKIFQIRPYGFDGIFEDESWGYVPISGRSWTAEYGTLGSGIAASDTSYSHDRRLLNSMVHDTLHSLNKYVFVNVNNDTFWARNVDGILCEGVDQPIWMVASNWDSLYNGSVYPANYYKNHLRDYWNLRDAGKINLVYSQWNGFEQSAGAEAITRYDTVGNHQWENNHQAQFENTFAGRNRSRVSSLAWYYIIASDSSYYWYEINYGYLPYEYYYSKLEDVDFGDPVDTAYKFASGVDDSGFAYTIARRDYYNSVTQCTTSFFYKPKSYMSDWWHCYTVPPCSITVHGGYYNTDDTLTWDKYPTTTHTLSGHWLRFRFDGTWEKEDYSTISLRYNEGTILQKLKGCE